MQEELISRLKEYILPERADRIREVIESRTRLLHVAIEDTSQERNAGALFRTCDCFGVQDVSVIENKYNHKVINIISRGAVKWLTINKYQEENQRNTLSCIKDLRQKGYDIVATTPHNPDISLPEFRITGKTALFFGTEESGLSEEALNHADVKLSIPIYGFTESYNISVSAALILQQLVQQIRKDGLNWQLSDQEKYDLELDWIIQSIGRSGPALYQKVLKELSGSLSKER